MHKVMPIIIVDLQDYLEGSDSTWMDHIILEEIMAIGGHPYRMGMIQQQEMDFHYL
jgi:hypothetical protein